MAGGSGFIDDWIAEGGAKGEARGEVREARRLAEHLLSKQFGKLPEVLITRMQVADKEGCERLLD